MERNDAMSFILKLLKLMLEKDGSDLFITAGFPPAMKIKGIMTPISKQPYQRMMQSLLLSAS